MSAGDATEALERAADAHSARLLDVVDALNARRREAAEVETRARRSAAPVGIALLAGAAALAVGALVLRASSARAAVERLRPRSRPVSFAYQVARGVALSATTYLIASLVKRGISRTLSRATR